MPLYSGLPEPKMSQNRNHVASFRSPFSLLILKWVIVRIVQHISLEGDPQSESTGAKASTRHTSIQFWPICVQNYHFDAFNGDNKGLLTFRDLHNCTIRFIKNLNLTFSCQIKLERAAKTTTNLKTWTFS